MRLWHFSADSACARGTASDITSPALTAADNNHVLIFRTECDPRTLMRSLQAKVGLHIFQTSQIELNRGRSAQAIRWFRYIRPESQEVTPLLRAGKGCRQGDISPLPIFRSRCHSN